MKKFKFKFQSVLDVRKLREREFLRQLSRMQRAHQQEIQKKEQLLSNLNNAFTRRENFGSKVEDVTSFALEDKFITGTKLTQVFQLQSSKYVQCFELL